MRENPWFWRESEWKNRDFTVTSKRVNIARFPHATGSPSTHSCLVPHPFVVIENVVEESLAYSPLLKPNMRVMAQFLPIIYRTMRWFGLKSRWHFTATQALCSKVFVSQAHWKVKEIYIYTYICIHIYAMYTYDIIVVITIRITIIHSQLQPDCRKPTHPNKLTTKWVTTHKIVKLPALLPGSPSHAVSPVPPSPLCGTASETSPQAFVHPSAQGGKSNDRKPTVWSGFL